MEKLWHLARIHGTKHRHFLLYALIGVSGVVIDYAFFAFGTKALGLGVLIANFIAISLGIINNFWLNTKYNFKTHDYLLKRFALFYAVGALGIVLSEILIFIFHYGMGIDDLIGKLLTLPFVLVFQFVLNRRFSFGNIQQSERQLKRLFFHWPALVILALYAFCSLIMVTHIPANFSITSPKGGPDEGTHYVFNVAFIKNAHRLPISGKDDLQAYRTCRDNPTAAVPCVYSYNVFPGPNYVLSAISASVLSKTGRINPETAARATSFVSGLVFVIFSYATVYAIIRRRLFATILTATIAFIPQVIFTNSYTNLDAHSLGISAILCFAIVKFMQAPRSRLWQIFCAVALFGLLPLSKYNYFVLGFGAALLVLYTIIRTKFTWREIARFGIYAFASFMVLSSFWYIRNFILYHDPLGQNFVLHKMAEFHALGTSRPLNIHSLLLLVHGEFFETLFRSFFYGFGLMIYFLEDYKYIILELLLIVAGAIGLFFALNTDLVKREKLRLWGSIVLYAFVGFGTLGTIIYNSLIYDYQPQGRYMFPILVPTIMLVAYAVRKDKRFQILIPILLAGTIFIFIQGLEAFIQIYYPV